MRFGWCGRATGRQCTYDKYKQKALIQIFHQFTAKLFDPSPTGYSIA
ncbi:hypothetical protein AO385_0850 [Moraxella catarrhalis]|nr:hypothetical protein AO385_0850 [Moraxella catarrhalis]